MRPIDPEIAARALRAYRRAWRATAGNIRVEVHAIDVPVRTIVLTLNARAGGVRFGLELHYRVAEEGAFIFARAVDEATEAMHAAVDRGLR